MIELRKSIKGGPQSLLTRGSERKHGRTMLQVCLLPLLIIAFQGPCFPCLLPLTNSTHCDHIWASAFCLSYEGYFNNHFTIIFSFIFIL